MNDKRSPQIKTIAWTVFGLLVAMASTGATGQPPDSQPQTDGPRMAQAYQQFNEAFEQLIGLAGEHLVSGPPELRGSQESWWKARVAVDADPSPKNREAFNAADTEWVLLLDKVRITGPAILRDAQQRYFEARDRFERFRTGVQPDPPASPPPARGPEPTASDATPSPAPSATDPAPQPGAAPGQPRLPGGLDPIEIANAAAMGFVILLIGLAIVGLIVHRTRETDEPSSARPVGDGDRSGHRPAGLDAHPGQPACPDAPAGAAPIPLACPGCSADLVRDARYCHRCGRKTAP